MLQQPGMRVLILGGRGRLGSRMGPLLRDAGCVVASPARERLDARDPGAVGRGIQGVKATVVLCLAAYTRVDRAEREPEAAKALTTGVAFAAAHACEYLGVPLLYVSTDYVFCDAGPHAPTPGAGLTPPRLVYGAAKLAAENIVLANCERSQVARMSFVDHADVAKYSWLNEYTRSSREWVGAAAQRLTVWMHRPDRESAGPVVHLAPPNTDTTVAAMTRARFPRHEAVRENAYARTEADCLRLFGYLPPQDTRLAGCPELLRGDRS